MKSKHLRILEKMFHKPTPSGIRWADIIAMLNAAGEEDGVEPRKPFSEERISG